MTKFNLKKTKLYWFEKCVLYISTYFTCYLSTIRKTIKKQIFVFRDLLWIKSFVTRNAVIDKEENVSKIWAVIQTDIKNCKIIKKI